MIVIVVGAYASTNAAVNNIVGRTLKRIASQDLINLDEKILLRLWTDQIELKILQAVDPANVQEFLNKYVSKTSEPAESSATTTTTQKPKFASQIKRQNYRDQVGYGFSITAAGAICKVLGLVETKNVEFLELRKEPEKYTKLKATMLNKASDRAREESNDIKRESKVLIDDILEVADVVFSNTAIGATFGSGKQKLILAGDVSQLLPTLISDNARYPESNRIHNSFSYQGKKTLLHRLTEICWPVWDQKEQLRMTPGMFDLVNFVIYRKFISYYRSLNIDDERFAIGRGIRDWSDKLNVKGMNSTDKFKAR
ncbi:hypothetical protein IFR05_004122 [Cadophora sp. M221]|nr:hypothetical protein IFR05_004122 [Cadophora sp. M221]